MTTFPESATGFRCAVSAHTWLSVRAADTGSLRADAAAAFPNTLTPAVLKQSDEQGLVALIALHQALQAGSASEELNAWGVVAAPRTLGRRRIAESLIKFSQQGAWSTSPHLIPYLSLHSLPGLLSQAVASCGPNLGAGGLKGSEGEALALAVALLHGERLPGVFVVFTGWERESLTLDPDDRCQAAVLGLRAASGLNASAELEITPGRSDHEVRTFTLESLGESLSCQSNGRWKLTGAVCSMSFEQCQLEAAA